MCDFIFFQAFGSIFIRTIVQGFRPQMGNTQVEVELVFNNSVPIEVIPDPEAVVETLVEAVKSGNNSFTLTVDPDSIAVISPTPTTTTQGPTSSLGLRTTSLGSVSLETQRTTRLALVSSPVVTLEATLGEPFVEELNNRSSEQYIELESQVVTMCDFIFFQAFGSIFIRTIVLGFRPQMGNAQVEMELEFNNSVPIEVIPDPEAVVDTLVEAVKTGNNSFALTVDPDSIAVISPTTTQRPTSSLDLGTTTLGNISQNTQRTTHLALVSETTVILEATLGEPFVEELNNRSSEQYIELENQVVTMCDFIFFQAFGSIFIRTIVLRFRPQMGNTQVEVELEFNNSVPIEVIPDPEVVVETLVEAVKTGNNSFNLNVIPESITIISEVSPKSTTTNTPTSTVDELTSHQQLSEGSTSSKSQSTFDELTTAFDKSTTNVDSSTDVSTFAVDEPTGDKLTVAATVVEETTTATFDESATVVESATTLELLSTTVEEMKTTTTDTLSSTDEPTAIDDSTKTATVGKSTFFSIPLTFVNGSTTTDELLTASTDRSTGVESTIVTDNPMATIEGSTLTFDESTLSDESSRTTVDGFEAISDILTTTFDTTIIADGESTNAPDDRTSIDESTVAFDKSTTLEGLSTAVEEMKATTTDKLSSTGEPTAIDESTVAFDESTTLERLSTTADESRVTHEESTSASEEMTKTINQSMTNIDLITTTDGSLITDKLTTAEGSTQPIDELTSNIVQSTRVLGDATTFPDEITATTDESTATPKQTIIEATFIDRSAATLHIQTEQSTLFKESTTNTVELTVLDTFPTNAKESTHQATTAFLSDLPVIVSVQATLEEPFVNELNIIGSEQYRQLETKVVSMCDFILLQEFGRLFIRTIVVGFSPKGENTQVELDLEFNSSAPTHQLPEAQVVVETLVEAVNSSNNMFPLSIDPDSIAVVSGEATTHTPSPTHGPTSKVVPTIGRPITTLVPATHGLTTTNVPASKGLTTTLVSATHRLTTTDGPGIKVPTTNHAPASKRPTSIINPASKRATTRAPATPRPSTTLATAIVVSLTATLEEPFVEEFNDVNSAQYRALEVQVVTACDTIYRQRFVFTFIRTFVIRITRAVVVTRMDNTQVDVGVQFKNDSSTPVGEVVVRTLQESLVQPNNTFNISIVAETIQVIQRTNSTTARPNATAAQATTTGNAASPAAATAALTSRTLRFRSVGETFTSDLLDQSSDAFAGRAGLIQRILEPLFDITFSAFKDLRVTSFSNGSIVNNMDLRFTSASVPANNLIANVLINAAQNITDFNVDTSSIFVDGVEFSSGPSQKTSFITATTVVLFSWVLSSLQ
ncbi:uncharacterized protein LOC144213274 [Stigmatopora nigra]